MHYVPSRDVTAHIMFCRTIAGAYLGHADCRFISWQVETRNVFAALLDEILAEIAAIKVGAE